MLPCDFRPNDLTVLQDVLYTHNTGSSEFAHINRTKVAK